MCGLNVSLLSMVTPSVLTVSESGTAVPARSTLESGGKERRRWHEPNRIASDLFGFMAKCFKGFQSSEQIVKQRVNTHSCQSRFQKQSAEQTRWHSLGSPGLD